MEGNPLIEIQRPAGGAPWKSYLRVRRSRIRFEMMTIWKGVELRIEIKSVAVLVRGFGEASPTSFIQDVSQTDGYVLHIAV